MYTHMHKDAAIFLPTAEGSDVLYINVGCNIAWFLSCELLPTSLTCSAIQIGLVLCPLTAKQHFRPD